MEITISILLADIMKIRNQIGEVVKDQMVVLNYTIILLEMAWAPESIQQQE